MGNGISPLIPSRKHAMRKASTSDPLQSSTRNDGLLPIAVGRLVYTNFVPPKIDINYTQNNTIQYHYGAQQTHILLQILSPQGSCKVVHHYPDAMGNTHHLQGQIFSSLYNAFSSIYGECNINAQGHVGEYEGRVVPLLKNGQYPVVHIADNKNDLRVTQVSFVEAKAYNTMAIQKGIPVIPEAPPLDELNLPVVRASNLKRSQRALLVGQFMRDPIACCALNFDTSSVGAVLQNYEGPECLISGGEFYLKLDKEEVLTLQQDKYVRLPAVVLSEATMSMCRTQKNVLCEKKHIFVLPQNTSCISQQTAKTRAKIKSSMEREDYERLCQHVICTEVSNSRTTDLSALTYSRDTIIPDLLDAVDRLPRDSENNTVGLAETDVHTSPYLSEFTWPQLGSSMQLAVSNTISNDNLPLLTDLPFDTLPPFTVANTAADSVAYTADTVSCKADTVAYAADTATYSTSDTATYTTDTAANTTTYPTDIVANTANTANTVENNVASLNRNPLLYVMPDPSPTSLYKTIEKAPNLSLDQILRELTASDIHSLFQD
jgi:hypothetical protein